MGRMKELAALTRQRPPIPSEIGIDLIPHSLSAKDARLFLREIADSDRNEFFTNQHTYNVTYKRKHTNPLAC